MSETIDELELRTTWIICDGDGYIVARDPQDVHLDAHIDTQAFIEQDTGRGMREKVMAWLAAHPDTSSIELRIPKFTDGRSASLAARFREAGYQGELHASGDITQDLIFLLRRVGFTHFHLQLGENEVPDQRVLRPFKAYYQAAQDGSQPIWQRLGQGS